MPKKHDCKCIERINKAFEKEGSNTRLSVGHLIDFEAGKSRSTVVIEVEKEDTKKREKLKTLIPKFCPFCGNQYAND